TVHAVDVRAGLVHGLVNAEERIRVAVTRVERITCVVAEVVVSVVVSEGRLVLPASLHVNAGLYRVRTPDLGQVVADVNTRVVVVEGRVVGDECRAVRKVRAGEGGLRN